jgi:RNA polymerase sigma-70 factor, ECF subfamily
MYPFTVRPTSNATIPSVRRQRAAVNWNRSDDDDRACFTRLVLQHLGDAYSLARWITGDRADAEDVVHDACQLPFRGVGSAGDGSGRTWVLTIVRNTAYTWLRKNRPSAVLMVEDLDDIETAQATSGGSQSETLETALIAEVDPAQLEAAVAALPTPYRETMALHDVLGLSYREIGEVTGVPIGTVMSQLARARGRLIATMSKRRGTTELTLASPGLSPA